MVIWFATWWFIFLTTQVDNEDRVDDKTLSGHTHHNGELLLPILSFTLLCILYSYLVSLVDSRDLGKLISQLEAMSDVYCRYR